MSFTKAADELAVTQAAISHQVKALEDWLGRKLFHRVNRGLRLTDDGLVLLPTLTDSLDRMHAAVSRLSREDAAKRLTVSTMDSFAAGWLVPRLRHFRHHYPEIDVRVTTSDVAVDFATSDVDMAVRYGTGPWPGTHTVPLFEEEVFPVCSPELIDGPHPLREPGDLRHHTLLHDDMTITWRMWLTAAGVQGVDAERGPMYMHSNLVMQAAVSGEGVALGRSRLAADDIAAGRLVRPFALGLASNFSYFIVCAEGTEEVPKIVAFRDWLLAEAAATPAVETTAASAYLRDPT